MNQQARDNGRRSTIWHAHPYLTTAALVGGAAFAGVAALSSFRLSDVGEHAAGHAIGMVAAGLLLALIIRLWPPVSPDFPSRAARSLLGLGAAAFLAGQLLEVIGACGYDGNEQTSALARLHEVGVVVSPPGLLLALAGAGTALVLAILGRLNLLGSRWVTYGFIGVAAAVILFLVGGLIFGY